MDDHRGEGFGGGSDARAGGAVNRLANESSPYLLQHARNPVAWWPWCAEAFEEARRRRVPVFVSIGYSTCYWCHVMERESFEDEATARVLNERFVAIKVDREERPDVDDLYMAATQLLTGHGGWPMSVFVEPVGLRPFWAGTYYPPTPRHGLPSFTQLLRGMSDAYAERRDEVLKQAEELGAAVEEHLSGQRTPVEVGMGEVTGAVGALLKMFDRTDGGFGRAPKFPQPVYLELLMEARRRAGDEATRGAIDQAVGFTLDRMAIGGMFDQVGGGFHRYSVDAHWTVPHFEKMLYDNAMLLGVYADAAVMYRDAFYARVVKKTITYLLDEMRVEGGGFASAQDAEVEHREGGNYVWTREEVLGALGDEPGGDGRFACAVYGLDAGPNFKDPHHPEAPAVNVLRLADRPERVAQGMGIDDVGRLYERLDRVNARLLEVRAVRTQPGLDDKVIAGWNGLLIAGLARAGRVDERAIPAALACARFVLERMVDEGEGGVTLYRTTRAGRVGHEAPLEDYAYLAHGLLTLGRCVPEAREAMLDAATRLIDAAKERFWDDEEGGFFDTAAEAPDLFVRARSTYDGATPSASSVMLDALVDLATMRRERGEEWGGEDRGVLQDALVTLGSLSHAIAASPVSTANSTRALLKLLAQGAVSGGGSTRRATPTGGGAGLVTPVEVYASEERVVVGADAPASISLKVRIAQGHHVISPLSPGLDPERRGAGALGADLIPFHVHVLNGEGVRVYADYPEGAPMVGTPEIHAIDGEFEMMVAIEREGAWSGKPLIGITFQACTETECMLAQTIELDVAIDAG